MANLDTASKRVSGICIGLPFGRALPIPDGTIGQGDRQHIATHYSGILATEDVGEQEIGAIRFQLDVRRISFDLDTRSINFRLDQ